MDVTHLELPLKVSHGINIDWDKCKNKFNDIQAKWKHWNSCGRNIGGLRTPGSYISPVKPPLICRNSISIGRSQRSVLFHVDWTQCKNKFSDIQAKWKYWKILKEVRGFGWDDEMLLEMSTAPDSIWRNNEFFDSNNTNTNIHHRSGRT